MNKPKIEINAPVVIWYTVISFVILCIGLATNSVFTDNYFTCYRTSISDPMLWFRLVSYVFGHSSYSHYIGNFFLITLLGPMLEEKYGSKTLCGMMFLTALVGGVANVLITTSGLRGASGIAFMFIILSSCTSVKSGRLPLTMLFVVVIYLGQEFFDGVTSTDTISHSTHILGGMCGIIFGLYSNPNTKKGSSSS